MCSSPVLSAIEVCLRENVKIGIHSFVVVLRDRSGDVGCAGDWGGVYLVCRAKSVANSLTVIECAKAGILPDLAQCLEQSRWNRRLVMPFAMMKMLICSVEIRGGRE